MEEKTRGVGFARVLAFLGIFCLSLLLAPTGRAQAASTKTRAIKAYKTFLKKEQKAQGSGASAKAFSLAYVDDNSVPELYYDGTLYTYRGGKVVTLLEPVGSEMISGYYKKKGIVTVTYAHTQHAYTIYYKIKGKKATEVLRYQWDISSESNWTPVETYLYKSNTVTETVFNARLKKLVGSKKIKYFKDSVHTNTASNRKKYLK
ncbi:MAG: hypothetical protein LUI13_11635 [Lachnospiraceae bacterium]|nr:hypothetical protein [Lachnospiraceae bacterium]